MWPTKPKIFIMWPLKEKVYQHLIYIIIDFP